MINDKINNKINTKWIMDNYFNGIWNFEETSDYLAKRVEEELYTEVYDNLLEEGKIKE